jgi:hypothetical protein
MYVPKSQILTNLYTNGDEYVLSSSDKNYIGYYHRLSTGELFTGKNPNDNPVLPLKISTPSLSTTNDNVSRIVGLGDDPDPAVGIEEAQPWNVAEYLQSQGKNIFDYDEKLIPSYSYPQLTDKDYNLGSFIRYFAKKSNQNLYIEINKSQYDSLKNKENNWDYSSYVIFTITWTLTGPSPEAVSNINQSVVATTERQQKISGLLKYFKNYSQFYKA